MYQAIVSKLLFIIQTNTLSLRGINNYNFDQKRTYFRINGYDHSQNCKKFNLSVCNQKKSRGEREKKRKDKENILNTKVEEENRTGREKLK